jgi:hypothetical protein
MWPQLFTSELDMPRLRRLLFIALHSLQDLETQIHLRTRKVPSSVDEPLKRADEKYDTEGDDTIVFYDQRM